jgi:hypothetical protein
LSGLFAGFIIAEVVLCIIFRMITVLNDLDKIVDEFSLNIEGLKSEIEDEQKKLAELLPFKLADEFDTSTYMGRFRKNMIAMNPLNFYVSN